MRVERLALTAVLGVALAAAAALPAPVAAKPWIGVRGRHLVDRAGHAVRLLGVSRSGTEYSCQQGYGFFDGPSDAASIRAIRSWRVNAVRVPLNETCWLGINGVSRRLSGPAYRSAIKRWVGRLERAGLYVVLDLHWAAPGAEQATGIIRMVDADHAPDFWRGVASSFRDDRSVLFELYNEPHDLGWGCWEHGCLLHEARTGAYRAAGMAQLVAAVRSTGARQPLLLGGLDWARDLSGWLAHLPPDRLDAEVASIHTYNFASCYSACRAGLARIAERHPVVTSELGEDDCRHGYIDDYMRWADRHGVSYLGWAWDVYGGWTCRAGPSLIRDYAGDPTAFGIGLRDHLRALAGAVTARAGTAPAPTG
jgi:endoglucanase